MLKRLRRLAQSVRQLDRLASIEASLTAIQDRLERTAPAAPSPPASAPAAPPPAPGKETSGLSLLALQLLAWEGGIDEEVRFWRELIRTQGGQWPDDYANRMNRQIDNAEGFYRRLGIPVGSTATILDVGAGPLSILKNWSGSREISIVAVDPLAPYYDAIAAEFSLDRPIVTRQGFAEFLTALFDVESFDAVHCRNALDHSFDPVRGIGEMLHVVKVGGVVMLQHHRNEAERVDYATFHQWNLDERDGDFVIRNKNADTNITELLRGRADVTVNATDTWIEVDIRKTVPSTLDIVSSLRQQTSDLLSAFLEVATSR